MAGHDKLPDGQPQCCAPCDKVLRPEHYVELAKWERDKKEHAKQWEADAWSSSQRPGAAVGSWQTTSWAGKSTVTNNDGAGAAAGGWQPSPSWWDGNGKNNAGSTLQQNGCRDEFQLLKDRMDEMDNAAEAAKDSIAELENTAEAAKDRIAELENTAEAAQGRIQQLEEFQQVILQTTSVPSPPGLDAQAHEQDVHVNGDAANP